MARKHKQSSWKSMLATVVASSSLVAMNFTGVFLLKDNPFEPPAFVPPPPPREYLAQQCQALGCDALMLDTIAFCESSWRMVKNSHSSAYGYFQIIDGTEKTTPQYKDGERKFDPYTNIDMGIYLYQTRGTNPWNESRPCWSWRYRQAKAAVVQEN